MVSSRPKLHDFPTEILLEIVSYLGVGDILSLRQASRGMSAVTRLRDVWKQVLLSLGGTVLLQKRMELHTAAELEDIGISQGKATHIPNSGGEWRSIRQCRPASTHALSSAYLAPGGRFFLNLANYAVVVYVDLDAPEVAWRELIPTSSSGIITSSIAFEHIVDAPILTLHLALTRRRAVLESEISEESVIGGLPIEEISVWRVSAKLDEQGIICGLLAERLSSFCHTQTRAGLDVIKTIKLQGDYVVLLRGDTCSVIKWAAVDGLSGSVPGKVVHHQLCKYGQLACDNILVVSNINQITLWDLDEVEVSFSDSGSGVAQTPKWISPRSLPTAVENSWPPPQRRGGSIYQIIPRTVGISVLSFEISASGPVSISIRQLSSVHRHYQQDISLSRNFLVYINRNLSERGGRRLLVCSASYDDRQSHLFLKSIPFLVPFMPYRSFFDAFSSRVVLYEDSRYFHLGSLVVTRP